MDSLRRHVAEGKPAGQRLDAVERAALLANMLSLRETQTETRAAKSVRTQSKIGFFFEEAEDVQLKSPEERTDVEHAFAQGKGPASPPPEVRLLSGCILAENHARPDL